MCFKFSFHLVWVEMVSSVLNNCKKNNIQCYFQFQVKICIENT